MYLCPAQNKIKITPENLENFVDGGATKMCGAIGPARQNLSRFPLEGNFREPRSSVKKVKSQPMAQLNALLDEARDLEEKNQNQQALAMRARELTVNITHCFVSH